ncbi:hypothetical protein K435DRAFT_858555 [Dendrothele bispora CBS 962.96]|uniref:Uncharacterized protein n=1 Tax=Dendrothele bispora (strain CBS 962.96) TaxID=1314807 RepID=A0A4S8M2U0_DENBC|nr:hypothetical protein K435DRAFT_858555 [Dendrothele bispora CBS 962.96]
MLDEGQQQRPKTSNVHEDSKYTTFPPRNLNPSKDGSKKRPKNPQNLHPQSLADTINGQGIEESDDEASERINQDQNKPEPVQIENGPHVNQSATSVNSLWSRSSSLSPSTSTEKNRNPKPAAFPQLSPPS